MGDQKQHGAYTPNTVKILLTTLFAVLSFAGTFAGGVYAAGQKSATTKIQVEQNTKDIKRVEIDTKASIAGVATDVKDVNKKLDRVILLLLDKGP